MPNTGRFEQNVLWLEITVDQTGLVEHRERVQELLGEDADERGAEAAERVLLDELVEIRRQELEDEAQMAAVNEGIAQAQDVMLVVRVPGAIELPHQLNVRRSLTSSRIVTSIIDC